MMTPRFDAAVAGVGPSQRPWSRDCLFDLEAHGYTVPHAFGTVLPLVQVQSHGVSATGRYRQRGVPGQGQKDSPTLHPPLAGCGHQCEPSITAWEFETAVTVLLERLLAVISTW